MTKRALAKKLDVTPEVIGLWERGCHQPRVGHYPKIFDFLGKRIIQDPAEFARMLREVRYRNGWCQKKLGDCLGVSERSIGRWEKGQEPAKVRKAAIVKKIEALLSSNSNGKIGPRA